MDAMDLFLVFQRPEQHVEPFHQIGIVLEPAHSQRVTERIDGSFRSPLSSSVVEGGCSRPTPSVTEGSLYPPYTISERFGVVFAGGL